MKNLRKDIINDAKNNAWNVRDDLKNLTKDEIKSVADEATLPFTVLTLNVTGELNVGMMMRTACLMGAELFIIYGLPKIDSRSCVGSQNWLNIKVIDARIPGSIELDYTNFFSTLNELGYEPVFFDTGGISINNLDMTQFKNKKPCLIFGNEGLGIPKEVTQNRTIVTIPQRGVLRSLNVSNASSIAVYHFSNYLSQFS
jgi:tRNA G18 (ribose-2'-O)-methylase SpoU